MYYQVVKPGNGFRYRDRLTFLALSPMFPPCHGRILIFGECCMPFYTRRVSHRNAAFSFWTDTSTVDSPDEPRPDALPLRLFKDRPSHHVRLGELQHGKTAVDGHRTGRQGAPCVDDSKVDKLTLGQVSRDCLLQLALAPIE